MAHYCFTVDPNKLVWIFQSIFFQLLAISMTVLWPITFYLCLILQTGWIIKFPWNKHGADEERGCWSDGWGLTWSCLHNYVFITYVSMPVSFRISWRVALFSSGSIKPQAYNLSLKFKYFSTLLLTLPKLENIQ